MLNNLFSSILIVDDEKNTREGLKQFLVGKDYDVWIAEDGHQALKLLESEKPDLVLIDLKMPGMDGMTLLQKIKANRPNTIVIVMTAYGTVETAVQAMKAGAFHYVTKPLNLDELDLALKKALREQSLEHENKSLRQELLQERYETGKIICKSAKMKDLLQVAEQVAQSNATVLIQGESGTGKELLAHAIHNLSPRKNKPFITVHCAALTETLLASELFGHERGAFTGATERKIGRFERAHTGTLFLDEIAEISETTQVKLLRFLQGGELERVGSTKTIHVDVRLICATNKNLQAQVQAGKFREDLFYRINVILLRVPPLREHAKDIPVLAEHFLKHFAKINQKNIQAIRPQAMAKLQAYDWPGNIRELKNIVERMVVLAKDSSIGLDDIPENLYHKKNGGNNNGNDVGLSASNIASMEKTLISQALKNFNGNKSVAAKKLGISRRTLYRKLGDYKLNVNK